MNIKKYHISKLVGWIDPIQGAFMEQRTTKRKEVLINQ